MLRSVGEPTTFDFEPRDHLQLGELHQLFDFENAAKITSSKFAFFKNEAALLELALVNWAMREVSALGYAPVTTPDLCRTPIFDSCGFMPRDEASTKLTK